MGMHLHQTSSVFDFTDGFIIHATIKLSTDSPHYNTIASRYVYTGGNYYGYMFRIDNNKVRLTIGEGDSTPKDLWTNTGTTTIPDNTWVEVSAQFDNSANFVAVGWRYPGGADQGTGTSTYYNTPASCSPSGGLHIGQTNFYWGSTYKYQPFSGQIDEIEISWE
jgi:hypothetical protein